MHDTPEAATHSPALPVGTMLGNYIIRKVIGSGGFGITYLAQEEITEKLVVIKENYPADISFRDMNSLMVGPSGESRKEAYDWALKRFLDEAKILSRLSHPNIVPIRNAFKALGTAYYVMPHVEGTELYKAAPAPRNITAEWLLPVLEKILSALGYLHGQGLIHRDIKPNNILINSTGEPILIDFGTARALESTHSHTHIGTPGFMPFEQLSARGKRGPWTDFYALGATCYSLITGELPPHSVDRMEDDEYLPLAGNPSLAGRFPEHVLSSIDKALIMNRSKRWQSAQEWLDALKDKPAVTSVTIEAVPLTEPVNQARPEIIRTIPTYAQAVDELERLGISSDTYNDNLLSAAEKGEAHMTALLLTAGAGVNTTDEDGYTPLLMAVTNGHTDCLRHLLAAPGIDVNKATPKGDTPLICAALGGHTECLRHLLAAPGTDVNQANQYGNTPLICAAFNGHTDCVHYLLVAPEININQADNIGSTPLICAAEKGHTDCVRLLLAAPGIEVNVEDDESNTALFLAEKENHTECARLIRAAGGISMCTAIKLQQMNISPDRYDVTLLTAAKNGEEHLLKLLITAGTDVNKTNSNGCTPLIWAATNGHAECVWHLISAPGIDVNKATPKGDTPLSLAAGRGHTECVNLLLSAPGIDVNKANDDGHAPLFWAEYCGHTECAELIRAAGGNSGSIATKLQQMGISPKKYNSSLYTAAEDGNAEKIRLLLAAGADVNMTDKEGYTPLSLAASKNHTECVRLLLASPGIDVNKSNRYGNTPLILATSNGHTECVRLLLAAPGIDINKANKTNQTPLFWAELYHHTECARLIRVAGGR